jgi:protein TonB
VDTDVACEEPEYPVMSRRLEEEGSVRLQLLVSPEGRVVQSRIAKSSGHPRLDEATVAALSKCKFKPGTADGKPTESWASLEYVWHLE